MYTVSQFGWMIADEHRTGAYARAIEATVRPGMTVVDVGTGTGIFALLACRHGARKVYAIDPNPAIGLAREIAAENGFADRIEFFDKRAQDVALPEGADVVIADIRGILPMVGDSLATMIHVRERMLKPGGAMIPMRDTLFAALAQSPELYAEHSGPWDRDPFGFSMNAARRAAVNNWKKATRAAVMLSRGGAFATIEYESLASPNAGGEVTLTVDAAGTAHGLLIWFASELRPGIFISNAPDAPELVYGRGFFPFEQPLEVLAGDVAHVRVDAKLFDEYVWRWDVRLERAGQVVARSAQTSLFRYLCSSDLGT